MKSSARHNHDLIILGSGSTAFAAALHAASYGARVLMTEKSALGGSCINWGCIPSKTLIHAALFRHEAALGAAIGVGCLPAGVDAPLLAAHRDRVVQELRQERYLDLIKEIPGLELVMGVARFVEGKTIEVGGVPYRSERFLLAMGGTPRIPPLPGLEQAGYLTNRGALLLREIPESLLVIGGGVVAVELGQMFARLGSRVTILEHGARLLPMVDPEPAGALLQVLMGEGIDVVLNAPVCSVAAAVGGAELTALVSGEPSKFTGEKLLLAVGTAPATAGIGLEMAGVELDRKGFVVVDRHLRTSAPGIWAAGDVTGGMMIATVGAREGVLAVEDMFNPGCACPMDYHSVPMAIFTDPELGIVGHGEESARLAGLYPLVNVMPVSAIPKSRVTGHRQGVIKMVAEQGSGRLLGVQLLCHRGAELINEAALALKMGATVSDLANMQPVYPSMGEGLRLCAQGFSRDITRLSCCAE